MCICFEGIQHMKVAYKEVGQSEYEADVALLSFIDHIVKLPVSYTYTASSQAGSDLRAHAVMQAKCQAELIPRYSL